MLKHIAYQNDLPIHAELMSISYYPMHMHQDIQIIYVLNGSVDLKLSFKSYHLNKNDFHYIHSEDIHSFSSDDKDNLILVLTIDTEYMEKIYPNIRTTIFTMPTDKTLLLYHNQQLHLQYCIFMMIDELLKLSDGFAIRIEETLKTMFGILYSEFRGFTIDRKNKSYVYKRLQDIRQTERLGAIIENIYINYAEPSTLEEVASKQNLNPYYLSHLFSQTVGVSYRDFVNMVRAEVSEYDLLNSDLSISHIALSSGFSNSMYYNKHFKFWFGMTPGEYREKYVDHTILKEAPSALYHSLSDYRDTIQKTLGSLKNIYIGFPAEHTNRTIHIDKINFDSHSKLLLNLNCYNPDFFPPAACAFAGERYFDMDFINEHFNSFKIIIESDNAEEPVYSEDSIYDFVKCLLNELVTQHSCDFNTGVSYNRPMIYTQGAVKTPLYYILQFLARDYDGLYIDSSYIIMKDSSDYHILCWNLSQTRPRELTLKSGSIKTGSFMTISKINLDDYTKALPDLTHLYSERINAGRTAGTSERIIDRIIFSEEKSMFTKANLSVSIQLQKQSLCFISLLSAS